MAAALEVQASQGDMADMEGVITTMVSEFERVRDALRVTCDA
jgi:hypothetical protein